MHGLQQGRARRRRRQRGVCPSAASCLRVSDTRLLCPPLQPNAAPATASASTVQQAAWRRPKRAWWGRPDLPNAARGEAVAALVPYLATAPPFRTCLHPLRAAHSPLPSSAAASVQPAWYGSGHHAAAAVRDVPGLLGWLLPQRQRGGQQQRVPADPSWCAPCVTHARCPAAATVPLLLATKAAPLCCPG